MWEWTKHSSIERKPFPTGCLQDRLPWGQEEGKMFWAIVSLQSFYTSRRRNHKWKSSSPGPMEQKVCGLWTRDLLSIRLYWQLWLSCAAATIFPCRAMAFPDTWNTLWLQQKSSWLPWEKLCPASSSKETGNLTTAREKPYRDFLKYLVFTGVSKSYQLAPRAQDLWAHALKQNCLQTYAPP